MITTSARLDSDKKPVFLAAILLAGLFFRLYNLGGESLWLDEVLSVKYASSHLSQIVFQQKETPPLYYILLHWWIHLFGISESSLRLPSVICGFASVIMMYKTGKQQFDINAGKIGALLMAFSVLHIRYSQETRTYSLSVLLTLLSMYFFMQLLKGVRSRSLIGYVLSSILLIYSHVYGLFIILAQNIYFVSLCLFSKEARNLDVKKWLVIQSSLVLLFVPWCAILLHKVAEVQKAYWIPKPHIYTLISSFTTYSSRSLFLLLLFLIMVPFSFISFEKLRGGLHGKSFFRSLENFQWKVRLSNTAEIYFLLVWLTTPIIIPFIISRVSQPIYLNRYTIVASPAFYLLVAGGIGSMRSRRVRLIAISIVIILSLTAIRGYYSEMNKEQWREVAEDVDASAKNTDIVLLSPSYYIQPFNYYDHRDLPFRKGFPEDGRKVIDERDISELRKTVAYHDRVWLILSDRGDKKGRIADALLKSYNLRDRREYKHINLYLFDKRDKRTVSRFPVP